MAAQRGTSRSLNEAESRLKGVLAEVPLRSSVNGVFTDAKVQVSVFAGFLSHLFSSSLPS